MPRTPKSTEATRDYAPKGYSRVEGSLREPMLGAKRTGPANPNETLSVTIRVRRRADAPPLPDLAYYATTPPGQRKYLDRAQFAAQYGASQQDLDAVTGFARGHGLTVAESNPGRRTIVLSGTVAQMNSA